MTIAYNLLRDSKKQESYSAGDFIFKEGDEGKLMYVVLEGEVLISKSGKVVQELTVGDLFGEMALIDTSPRSATAMSKGACLLAHVDQANFLFYVQHSPMFSLHVMKVMADRLRKQLTFKH